MSQAYILAIDQGTTNTKALLIDETGTVVSSASQQIHQSYPRPAWIEQDAIEICRASSLSSTAAWKVTQYTDWLPWRSRISASLLCSANDRAELHLAHVLV